MASRVITKINGRLRFLYRKQNFLDFFICRLLINALIQPHFEYASSMQQSCILEVFPREYRSIKARFDTQSACKDCNHSLHSKIYLITVDFFKILSKSFSPLLLKFHLSNRPFSKTKLVYIPTDMLQYEMFLCCIGMTSIQM